MFRRVAVGVTLLMVLSTSSTSASGLIVNTSKANEFQPKKPTINIGDEVVWHNLNSFGHTSTANAFSLWSVSIPASTNSSPVVFNVAGTFAYHCTIHTFMNGKIRVRMSTTPTTGTLLTQFTIKVANNGLGAGSGFQYSIERKAPGGSWMGWANITAPTAIFQPGKTGTYQFRVRLLRTSDLKASGWSPILSISITH